MMKFDYLTDESNKSLAPFFLPRILFAAFNMVLIVGVLSLLLWPLQPAYHFIAINSIPIHFFVITSATLLVHAYVNLRCGRGGLIKRDYLAELGKEAVVVFEKERNFLSYGLVEFFIHSLLLISPFLPLLILSASISGISMIELALAISIIICASLLCRMIGFTTYLIWGWWNVFGYWIGRVFAIFFLFGSILILREINPIWLLFQLNNSVQSSRVAFMDYYSIFMMAVISGNLFFVMINYLLVNRHIKKEKIT